MSFLSAVGRSPFDQLLQSLDTAAVLPDMIQQRMPFKKVSTLFFIILPRHCAQSACSGNVRARRVPGAAMGTF